MIALEALYTSLNFLSSHYVDYIKSLQKHCTPINEHLTRIKLQTAKIKGICCAISKQFESNGDDFVFFNKPSQEHLENLVICKERLAYSVECIATDNKLESVEPEYYELIINTLINIETTCQAIYRAGQKNM